MSTSKSSQRKGIRSCAPEFLKLWPTKTKSIVCLVVFGSMAVEKKSIVCLIVFGWVPQVFFKIE